MKQTKKYALAAELAKDLKTPEDLGTLSAQLTKITVLEERLVAYI